MGRGATKKEILESVSKMQEKYYNLVSYARKRPEDFKFDAVRRNAEMCRFNYPEEVENLHSEEMGDWQHGFNSGMLAALRYVMSADEDGIEQAEEEFPFLDT
jgi:hypothetical protein